MKKKISTKEFHEKNHFDKHANDYDRNYNYLDPFTKYKINKKFKHLARFIELNYDKQPITILDVGCGTGEYTKKIAQKYPKSKIIGLDISPQILKVAKLKCRRLRNASFVSGSAYATNFPKQKFDLIVGFYVLHHLDVKKFDKEALRILKKNGKMFFCEPNILNPIVYLIKSNRFLKERLGDSPDEWAINPLTIGRDLKNFQVFQTTMTEFIWPTSFLSFSLLKKLDKFTNYLRYVPLLKYFGGSVELSVIKK
jgi:ubiquinone/menaquinone biosynthesis C-methylase UbiE